jgi:hypothetical protein
MAKIVKKYNKAALLLALILVLVGIYWLIPLAKAGTVSSRSDTLSDSRPTTAANHVIQFTTATTVHASDTITVTFAASFNMGTVNFTDIDVKDGASELTLAAAPGNGGGSALGAVIAGQVLTITENDTDTILAGHVVNIEIGTNATGGDQQITNPDAEITYSITIGGTFGDTGTIQVAILSGVTVTATVAESLTFAIAAVTNDLCDADTAPLGGPDSTATTVPFGTLTINTFYHACQDLTISTNATSGYSITGQEQTNLMSGASTIDDSQGDNTLMTEAVSDTWATATNNGFALSCVNKTGTDCVFAYANYRQFACVGSDAQCDISAGGETAGSVMTNAGPVSSKQGRVEYKISVGGTQQAGDYTNTIVYIATPTY